MSFMKLNVTLIISAILALSILVPTGSATLAIYTKSMTSSSFLSYAQITPNDILDVKSADNKSSSSSLPSINQVHGTLIVTEKVINEGGGNKTPADFTINIHGNDPSPSSFPGSSSGTPVMLHMGMYSTTETGPSGYNSTLSGDCSGGMMSVETKNCTITNVYSKH
jgi:hypothetical protein